jgi:hypothetical protein
MPAKPDVPKKPYNLSRLKWIAIAAVTTFCACLGFIAFANRDNPSAVPTLRVEDLETSAASLSSPTPPANMQTVQIRLNPYLQGSLLVIEGSTDLPNRTLLLYEAKEGSTNPKVVNGTFPVLDGRFSRQVDLTGWHAGTIAVWVGFQTLLDGSEKQPEEIIERFGEMGEFLYGDNVTETDGLKRVEVIQTVEFRP